MDNSLFLRNIWYYALPGGTLKRGQMRAKMLLGEPILFGRNNDGTVFAIADICPHRGIPLSYGNFDGEEVECCYHGWRFDRAGRCTEIPALVEGQAIEVNRICVKSYPTREVQGNIWIYMPSAENPQEPEFDVPVLPEFGDRSYQFLQTIHFPCTIDHAVIGLMDPAHATFVHRVWWWRSRGALFEKSKAFDPSPYGFTMRRHQLLKTSFGYRLLGSDKPEVEIAFRLPGIRIETVHAGKHTLCNLTAVTPLSENETEVNSLFYWTVPWLGAIAPILRPLVKAFFHQDRDVIVKQQEGLRHNPTLMLIDDADAQARWYFQLKNEYARAKREGRSFENPVKSKVLRWRS
ncbi:aromatic ring-hydroxylating dioxygenase subunit alpha [Oscillatoria sp. FACHB-1406]|nr:aromatic ring-hydroxylating dioxygenase subunit alpha [Oscillatoria sp. FACHB-1406]